MSENKTVFASAQYIVVNIGSELFGIDIRYIDNIVRMQSITRVPKVPNYFKGVINLRGEIIPVMSLRLKMELDADEISDKTRIIIVKMDRDQEPIGIMVDAVREVVTLEGNSIEKANYNKGDKGNYLFAIGKHDGSLISLLDLTAVLAEKEV